MRRMTLVLLLLFLVATLAAPARAAGCETHPAFTASFRKSLNRALYSVKNQQHLAQVICQMRRIHREVTEHELTHFYAAKGCGSKPSYDTIELYGKVSRVRGCVRLKAGTPARIALIAALAPKRPSAQDRRVAAEARRILADAERRRQLLESLQRQHGR